MARLRLSGGGFLVFRFSMTVLGPVTHKVGNLSGSGPVLPAVAKRLAVVGRPKFGIVALLLGGLGVGS